MKAIGIFCGSSSGENPLYIETARYVGKTLAAADISIVYGGGKVGLMGAVADACLAHGGHVVGVMPRGLFEKEIAHKGLSELHVVENMHERKTKMAVQGHWKRFSNSGPGHSSVSTTNPVHSSISMATTIRCRRW